MAVSKKLEAEIREWFNAPQPDGFWVNYPTDLCSLGQANQASRWKGSKGEALKAILKVGPDEKERARILGNLKAQVRHDREALKRGDKVYRWPYCATYVNGWRFDDEIESVADIKPEEILGICSYKDCGEPCHGPNYPMCTEHTAEVNDRWKAERTRRAKELLYVEGGDNSKQAVIQRARELGSNGMRKLNKSAEEPATPVTDVTDVTDTKDVVGSREWFENRGWKNLDYDHNGLADLKK